MSTVIINKTEKLISVQSEYNSIFVDGARALAGKWNQPKWVFDIRDEKDVVELCMQSYGSDGVRINQCDIEVIIPKDCRDVGGRQCAITLFGRTIAKAWGRDSGAKVGDGVVIKSGGFDSGGSMKNWVTTVKDDTTFIMRDVSKYLVDNHTNEAFQVKIISAISNMSDGKQALIDELEVLKRRETEILNLLSISVEDAASLYTDDGVHTDLIDA